MEAISGWTKFIQIRKYWENAMSGQLKRRSVLKKGAATTLVGAGLLASSGTAAANNDYTMTIENTGSASEDVAFFVEHGGCSSGSFGIIDGETIDFDPEFDDDGDLNGIQVDGHLSAGATTVIDLECYEYPTDEAYDDDVIDITIET
ncbi:hypothetical protein [Halobiforma nitratireducens]|uniref:hypothetical protein n=1 Tax=Halobiforma nitratireducens TaxID=130048 RepID=UPI0012696D47|nr:hypothetical protein [Halobiforma nitratireducens]